MKMERIYYLVTSFVLGCILATLAFVASGCVTIYRNPTIFVPRQIEEQNRQHIDGKNDPRIRQYHTLEDYVSV